jgi:uncharacterized membrane protein
MQPPRLDTNPSADDRKPSWQFRGYEVSTGEFHSAMQQFYRGELERSNVWRTRLDSTTYWAVITALATVLYLFLKPDFPYVVLILGTLFVTLFLWIEARRYRYYELWSYRVRLMETDFFAAMLVPPFSPHAEWAESLAETLLMPAFPISVWEALGRRFRRNYIWIYLLIDLAGILRTYLFPNPATSWSQFVDRFAIGALSGHAALLIGLIYNATLFAVGLITIRMQRASGEVLPRFPFRADDSGAAESPHSAPATLFRRRSQFLSFVIAARPDAIADRVLKEMRRGVTGLYGRGMYTREDREVLMVALTVTEIAQFEQLVRQEDPNAFVIISPAQDVLGRGFQPMGA